MLHQVASASSVFTLSLLTCGAGLLFGCGSNAGDQPGARAGAPGSGSSASGTSGSGSSASGAAGESNAASGGTMVSAGGAMAGSAGQEAGGAGEAGGTSDVGGATGSGGSAGSAGATAGGETGTAGTSGAEAGGATGGFPAVNDFAASGPFDSMQTSGGPSCTIWRPSDATLGGPGKGLRHPVITWGNGTGATPTVYAGVLRHWATHGFIVTASTSTNTGDAVEMMECLEWVLEQDSVPGPYFGRIDARKLGASGHSQGGGGTLMVGRDPRIVAIAPLQPYILFGLGGFQSSSISQQKAPMFLMSGTADTIATPDQNQAPVFEATNVPVFWGTLRGATHTGTAVGSIGDYRGPATAWFRLHLMGDASARRLFYGDACGLCSDAKWAVERKQIQ